MCALRGPLGDINRIEMSALFIIIIGIINIYHYYLEFCIVPTKQKEKRKQIAQPTMWK